MLASHRQVFAKIFTCRLAHIGWTCLLLVVTASNGKMLDLSEKPDVTVTSHPDAGEAKKVIMRNSLLTQLPPGGFEAMGKLVTVDLSLNRLRSVDSSDFNGTIVSTLIVNDNKLHCVPTLASIKNTLTVLQMRRNKVEDCLDDFPLESYTKLAVLDLSYNKIKTLKPAAFNKTRLQVLKLSGNLLTCQPDLNTIGKTLWKLDMSSNKITECKSDTHHRGYKTLRDLNLNDNLLTDLDPHRFRARYLRHLHVRENDVTCIPVLGESRANKASSVTQICKDAASAEVVNYTLRHLEVLDLHGNNIDYINGEAFKGLKLKKLSLSHNSITCLPKIVNIRMTLSVLDLSNNSLGDCKTPTKTGNDKFPRLRQVSLRNTSLAALPGFLEHAPQLVSVHADENMQKEMSKYFITNKTTTTTSTTATTTTVVTYIPIGFIKLVPRVWATFTRLLPTTIPPTTRFPPSNRIKTERTSTTTKKFGDRNGAAADRGAEGSFITFFMVFVVILIITILVVAVRKRGEVEETEEFYSMYDTEGLRREGSIRSVDSYRSWDSYDDRYSGGRRPYRERGGRDPYRDQSFRSGYYSPYSNYSDDSRY